MTLKLLNNVPGNEFQCYRAIKIVFLLFVLFSFSLVALPLVAAVKSPDDFMGNINCTEHLSKAATILSMDYFNYYVDDAEAHDTPLKQRVLAKTSEYDQRKKELSGIRSQLLKCKYKLKISKGSFWSNSDGSYYDEKHKGFLIYAGNITETEILVTGINNSKGVVILESKDDEYAFKSAKYDTDNNDAMQFTFTSMVIIGDMPNLPVGMYNAGKHFFLLKVSKDEEALLIEETISGSNGYSFYMTFELGPRTRKWLYSDMGPFGRSYKNTSIIKNFSIQLVNDESGDTIKIWK